MEDSKPKQEQPQPEQSPDLNEPQISAAETFYIENGKASTDWLARRLIEERQARTMRAQQQNRPPRGRRP